MSSKQYDLDTLYGLSLGRFEERLQQEVGIDINVLIKLLKFEIKILRESYMRIANNRDLELSPELVEAVNKSLHSKREKLIRYQEWAETSAKNKTSN